MGLIWASKSGWKGVANTDEVWHFPNKTDMLFKDYVKTFLKEIDDCFEKEGIALESDKIYVNKAEYQ